MKEVSGTAVGERGVNVDGDVGGSIITGDVKGDIVQGDKVEKKEEHHHHYSTESVLTAPTFPLYHRLFPSNPHFTGRKKWLTRLHDIISAKRLIALTGLGGVGKTQLVLAYCYRHLDQYDCIAWLSADDPASLNQSLAELAYTLGVAQRGAGELDEAVRAALQWLKTTKRRWLLVYDNADHIQPQALAAYLPKLGNGVSLITSRNPTWQSLTGAEGLLHLDVFLPDEAVAFLWQYTGQEDATAAAMLAQELGYLPLALEHAAAYISTRHKSYAAYLALYQHQRRKLWARAAIRHDYEKTITTTWELAFSEAKKTPGAAELLNLCCFLAADAIPFTLLTDYSATLPEILATCVQDELALDDALTTLGRYSLLSRSDSAVTIHRLVQAVGRDRMGAERRALWGAAAVNLTLQTFPDDQNKIYVWAAAEQLLPHARAAADLSRAYDLATQTTAALCSWISFYLQALGDYTAARPYMERALVILEKSLGEDHPQVATGNSNLGLLLQDEGDYAGARPYLERALAISEKALGPDHPDVAIYLNNLGQLHQAEGDYAGARPYLERALAIFEKILGKDHPNVATLNNNLGQQLKAEGDYAGARPYLERALAISEKALGPNHPDVAIRLNNLGTLLQAEGDYAAARPYLERALAIFEKILGKDHPNVATLNNNLGQQLKAEGDYAGARPYMERALVIDEKALGPDHPDVATDLNNLGQLLQAEGDYAGARPYLERALAIDEKALGPDHPSVAIRLNNLGTLLQAEGDYAGARPYLERALAIDEKALGPDHPQVATGNNNLAILCYYEGDFAEAARLMRQALTIREKALGSQHPDTQSSRQSLEIIESKLNT